MSKDLLLQFMHKAAKASEAGDRPGHSGAGNLAPPVTIGLSLAGSVRVGRGPAAAGGLVWGSGGHCHGPGPGPRFTIAGPGSTVPAPGRPTAWHCQ